MTNSRREFLKTFLLSGIAVLFSAPIFKVVAGPVKMDDILVKGMGYVEDSEKSTERKDKKAKCGNCHFFQSLNSEKKNIGRGTCSLLSGKGDVSIEGWCRSWSLKAKA